jgi:hypothetical protein
MAERKQCEFQLIRYVPDPVRNEFVNIGVLLRAPGEAQTALRFTRNWGRVQCLDPDADTELLEALESEISDRLRSEPADHPKPVLQQLESSLSNGIQITESRAYLAESFLAGLEDLMRLYVDPPRRERKQPRGGRAGIQSAMRNHFEDAGVWGIMNKKIAASQFTFRGDPLKIDCGYRNGLVKMFHAVSLDSGLDDAKLLCFAAPALFRGVKEAEKIDLELTAITEPLLWPEGEGLPDAERSEISEAVDALLQEHEIRHLTTADLDRVAARAREDLKV